MVSYSGIKKCSERLAEKSGISKLEASRRFRDALDVMRDELLHEECDGLQFLDFLTLKKVDRKARVGRDPKDTNRVFDIPPSIGIKCELGGDFFSELNQ